jgi:hypothetical protein
VCKLPQGLVRDMWPLPELGSPLLHRCAQVFHMMGPPTELFSPNIAWRTARQWALRKARALQGGGDSSSGGGGGSGTGLSIAAPGDAAVTTAAAAAQRPVWF